MSERKEIIDRAHATANAIADIFADCDRWNRTHPTEEPIHPDPDGQLERAYHGLVDLLRRENMSLDPPDRSRRLVQPLVPFDPQPTPDEGGEGE